MGSCGHFHYPRSQISPLWCPCAHHLSEILLIFASVCPSVMTKATFFTPGLAASNMRLAHGVPAVYVPSPRYVICCPQPAEVALAGELGLCAPPPPPYGCSWLCLCGLWPGPGRPGPSYRVFTKFLMIWKFLSPHAFWSCQSQTAAPAQESLCIYATAWNTDVDTETQQEWKWKHPRERGGAGWTRDLGLQPPFLDLEHSFISCPLLASMPDSFQNITLGGGTSHKKSKCCRG